MKIVIYGASEIGSLIAKEFHQVHEITVIDKEENKTDEFSRLDVRFITCEAITLEVLKAVDIKNIDSLIACSTNYEKNILACLTAKRISNVKTICFVSKEEYKTSMGLTRDSEYASTLFIDNIFGNSCRKIFPRKELQQIYSNHWWR